MQVRIRHLYRAAPETVQRATHAREPSLLAPNVRVQPLLEIYTTEVRFTRKMIFTRMCNLYAISLSNCPKLSDNPRIKTVEHTVSRIADSQLSWADPGIRKVQKAKFSYVFP